jgi:hypothetical protein
MKFRALPVTRIPRGNNEEMLRFLFFFFLIKEMTKEEESEFIHFHEEKGIKKNCWPFFFSKKIPRN